MIKKQFRYNGLYLTSILILLCFIKELIKYKSIPKRFKCIFTFHYNMNKKFDMWSYKGAALFFLAYALGWTIMSFLIGKIPSILPGLLGALTIYIVFCAIIYLKRKKS